MKKLIGIFILIIPTFLFAQNKLFIQGIVIEKNSGESIIDANVLCIENNTHSLTDNNGHFVLNSSSLNKYTLIISKTGYKNDTLFLNSTDINKLQKIELSTITKEIKNVVIKSNTTNKSGVSLVEIPLNKLKLLPRLAGEVDVLKSYQLMPGIQGGSEGTSGLFVRGGSPDQNLILIDDVPVYNVSHLGGFLSILDINAVNKVSVIKGGFPARYGGRLSSVIDVRMKEGNANKLKCTIDLGALSTKLFVEGNYKHKTRFMFSARRFNLDIPARIITKSKNGKKLIAGYSFYDLYAKITHVINDKNKLSLFVYNGRDNIFLKEYVEQEIFNAISKFKGNLKWGNTLVGLKLTQNISPKLIGNATLSYTKFKYSTDFHRDATTFINKELVEQVDENYTSSIADVIAKYEISYVKNEKMLLHTGISFVNKIANPSQKTLYYKNPTFEFDTIEKGTKIFSKELIGYIENEHIISPKLKMDYGMYVLNFLSNGKYICSFQPRFLLTYTKNENININISYSKMTQNLHLLSNNNAGLPTDLWVPATKNTPPSNCHQLSISTNYRFNDKRFVLSADLYYKRYNHLIEFKDGISFTNFRSDWENNIEKNGVGNATGLEMLLEKKEGRFNGWIGYTLAYNYRKFDNINDGKYYPYRYDRRHNFSIVGNYSLKQNIIFSFAFVANSGYAVSLPVGSYPTPVNPPANNTSLPQLGIDSLLFQYHNSNSFIYKGRNGSRMPVYHRLDISLTFHKELKKGTRDWVISVYNVYNKQNPFFYYFDYDKQFNLHMYQITLFPIIPSISYNRTF